jgi:hypothetical protein
MEREKVLEIVDPLFQEQGCVERDVLLDRIDSSDLDRDQKRVLQSIWDSKCYTRDEFARVLRAYGRDSPIGYGAGSGG